MTLLFNKKKNQKPVVYFLAKYTFSFLSSLLELSPRKYKGYICVSYGCIKLLSITIFHLYHGGHFYWCRNPEYAERTTDLPQVTDELKDIKIQDSTSILIIFI